MPHRVGHGEKKAMFEILQHVCLTLKLTDWHSKHDFDRKFITL
jgi:hypothetical protein